MDEAAIRRYAEIQVLRYTSYPTAADFSKAVGPKEHASWLREVDGSEQISIYIHVPYCRALCRYCGCHAKLVSRDDVIANYARLLKNEIELIGLLPTCRTGARINA